MYYAPCNGTHAWQTFYVLTDYMYATLCCMSWTSSAFMCCAGQEEPTAMLATLQQLKQVRVTQEVLVDTGAGKAVKAFSKAKSTKVAEAAKAVVKAWRQCIVQT